MRHVLISFAALVVAFATSMQPSNALVVMGPDKLVEPLVTGGQPDDLAAARPKPVCMQGPRHATPQCLYDSIVQCRAVCRSKSGATGYAGPRGGRINCFVNPALKNPALVMERVWRQAQ
jgi:hypothetical protein